MRPELSEKRCVAPKFHRSGGAIHEHSGVLVTMRVSCSTQHAPLRLCPSRKPRLRHTRRPREQTTPGQKDSARVTAEALAALGRADEAAALRARYGLSDDGK
jgi:hypothetical protein